MGRVGLHGRAFIPLLSSFACAIPGIMATRIIGSRSDRLATILMAPLMTCSARLPVYTLLIAAFIPDQKVAGVFNLQGVVLFGLYAAAVVIALSVGFVLKRTVLSHTAEPFLMELPTYKVPSGKNLLIGLWERVRVFMRRAGTVIFVLMVLIWLCSTFPEAPEGATEPAISYSFAGMLGQFLAPLFAPLGWSWQAVVALVPGMAAREVAVAALGTVYAVSEASEASVDSLAATLATAWTLPAALAFLMWYVVAPQCASTIAVIKRETNSWKWAMAVLVGYFLLAYALAFGTYRAALLFSPIS
jgi:ferrous iron transport protein B